MARRVVPGSGGIAIDGDNCGIASTGSRATLVQVQLAGGAAEICDVRDLVARELPVLSTLAEDEPVGRGEVIGRVVAELVAGVSVQLHGAGGTGRKAIARAVIRRLGARGVRGVALLPLGEPHSLAVVYERLATAFFGVLVACPPEEILKAAADQLTGVVFVGDCDLPAGEVTRLLATFPRCAFLLTSEHLTIGRAGAGLEVEPLGQAAAVELMAQQIGGEPAGLAWLPLEQACRLAGGQPQRLLQYAAFLASASRLGYPAHTLVTPQEAATILASGLSEPARRILVTLATFGELAPEYFAAATGWSADPVGWTALFQAVPELLSVRLVTLASDRYRIAPDAAAAVRAHHWEPARPDVAAQGLLPYLTGDRSASVPPSCALLLSVARDLVTGHQDLLASRFIRAAAPAALAAGQIRAWAQLIALGVPAALAAGAHADLQYFLQEERTRAQIHGDKAALAAVLALLAQNSMPSRSPGLGRSVARAGYVRHLTGPVKAAIAAGAAITVTAGIVVAVVVARHGGVSGGAASQRQLAAFTVTQRVISQSRGAPDSYTATARYPVVTGLPDAGLQRRVDAELRLPAQEAVAGLTRTLPACPTAGIPADEYQFIQVSDVVYRAGRLLSVEYSIADHLGGGASVGYSLQAVTIRLDNGTMLAPAAVLTAAGLSAPGLNRLAADLQALPGISSCDADYGGEAGVATVLADLRGSSRFPGVVLNVTRAGLEFSFADSVICAPAFRPVGILPLGELTGLVNPEVVTLSGSPRRSGGQ